jgi:hexulose-6-phosphate isomerase
VKEISQQATKTALKKSIMWGSVGMQGSILEKCKAIKEAGFEGIEPNSHMDRKEVLDAMQATGLKASSVCNSKHWDLPMSHPDKAIRQQGMDAMIVAMEDAKAYGTDAVLLVPGRVDENVSYDDCWKRSTACIRQLLPVAQDLKVKICIENVWNNFILSPLEARSYIDQFNSPYVGFYFDCGNILVYGWPEQWIKILGYRVGRIHIKEFSNKIGNSQGKNAGFGVKLTEGDVRWKEVIEQIRNEYVGGWLTTEQGSSRTLEDLKDLSSRFDTILAM